jgi:hypothetical protein
MSFRKACQERELPQHQAHPHQGQAEAAQIVGEAP